MNEKQRPIEIKLPWIFYFIMMLLCFSISGAGIGIARAIRELIR